MPLRRLPSVPPRLRSLSRLVPAVAAVFAVAVSVLTLSRLPHVTWWPVLLGVGPWLVGKYVLCPLRWHALSESGRRRGWHLRAYAESELFGLCTPGHIGADAWRIKRLTGIGMHGGNAVAEVALDRCVGAVGLAVFVAFAGAALPTSMLITASGLAGGVLLAALILRRVRPDVRAERVGDQRVGDQHASEEHTREERAREERARAEPACEEPACAEGTGEGAAGSHRSRGSAAGRGRGSAGRPGRAGRAGGCEDTGPQDGRAGPVRCP